MEVTPTGVLGVAETSTCPAVIAARVQDFPLSCTKLRLLVGEPPTEFFACMATLCAFSCHLKARTAVGVSEDIDSSRHSSVEHDVLLPHDTPDTWRRVLADLCGTLPRASADTIAALPLCSPGLRVSCLCAPSAADARVIVESQGEEGSWEFLCRGATLRQGSEYFAAALQPGAWAEGECQEIRLGRGSNDDHTIASWRWILLRLEDLVETVPCSSVQVAVHVLGVCHRYLFEALEQDILSALCNRVALREDFIALDSETRLAVARELALIGALPRLLGSWCMKGGRRMVAPLVTLLDSEGFFRNAALSSAGVAVFLVSDDFLGAWHEVPRHGGPIGVLAAIGALDELRNCRTWSWLRGPADLELLLGDEALFPALQLPGLRRALRHPRFRDASLAKSLASHPEIFDDLVNAWFDAPWSTGAIQDAALVGLEAEPVKPAELALWAASERFCRQGLLWRQLAEARLQELAEFARQCPVHGAVVSVAEVLRARLRYAYTLAAGSWSFSKTRQKVVSRLRVRDAIFLAHLLWAQGGDIASVARFLLQVARVAAAGHGGVTMAMVVCTFLFAGASRQVQSMRAPCANLGCTANAVVSNRLF